jgi:glyoxylase-like metal-dependent hydrolase (beta-lactamase superfamily II)
MRHKAILAISLLAVLGNGVFSAAQETRPSLVTTKIGEGIYKFFVHGYVNMVAFLGPEGVLLVDSGFKPFDLVRAELKKLGGGEVKFIINTHLDGDHTLGNSALGPAATVISGRACRDRLAASEKFPNADLPGLTFRGAMTLHFNGEEIVLFEAPGHTDTDIVVHFKKAGIVCFGDLVFADSFPGFHAETGGSPDVTLSTLKDLAARLPEGSAIVVGHGRDLRMSDLRAYIEMMEKTLALIRAARGRGRTAADMKKDDLLKAWKSWNNGMFRDELGDAAWIDMVCGYLLNKKQP